MKQNIVLSINNLQGILISITDRGALLRVFIEHVCSSHVDPGRTKSNTVDN